MEDLIRSDDAAGKEESGQDLEQMFTELEALIGKMEDSDVTLEQSFDLYNRGMELLKKCNQTIDTVEKKVLVLDENGETHEF
ncbi:MAG TPA: exodeoxyribonuclease VII small subunit [Candidatus Mediterraneibacter excrementavium]|nr:exodeoxyribonuclease VII small subunit [Candidatus Mediterraneibacter excrementavium]